MIKVLLFVPNSKFVRLKFGLACVHVHIDLKIKVTCYSSPHPNDLLVHIINSLQPIVCEIQISYTMNEAFGP